MRTYTSLKLSFLLLLSVAVCGDSLAQTPQYSFTNGTSSNAIPLGSGTSWEPYMSQFLYLPGDFAPAVPTGPVKITTIYFKVGSTGTTATTFNNFQVMIGNTTQTAMTTTFITGLTQVLNATTLALPGIANGNWMKIDLNTPVLVDLSQPLVVDIRHNGKVGGVGGYSLLSGGAPVNPIYTGNTQTYFKSTTATTGTTRRYSYQFGIDVITCESNIIQQPVDNSLCAGSTALFSAKADIAQQYQWQVNSGSGWVNLGDDAVYSGTQTTNLTVKNTTMAMNNYKYHMIAINTGQSCAVESDDAKLLMIPSSKSSVVISAAPDSGICLKEEVTFTSAYTKGGATPQYRWLLNGLEIPNAINATLKIDSLDHGDIVQCRFISSELCVIESLSQPMKFSIVDNLVAAVGLSVGYNGGTSYTFIASPQNGGTNPKYVWYVNGQLVPNETGQSFTTDKLAPWDKVEVGMLTSRDCAEPKLAKSRLATTSVATAENNSSEALVFPNPNKGVFILKAKSVANKDAVVLILNSVGQVVYNANIIVDNGNIEHYIDLGGKVAPGIYMLHLFLDGQQKQVKFNISDN